MFNSHRYQSLLFLKLRAIITVPVHKTSLFLPYSFNFCTKTAPESNPFAVSYLINNLGFSPQSALKASKRLRFKTPEKPDLVLAFFKSHGFSPSQMSSTIRKQPQLLVSSSKKLLPKFEFLASKGASTSDIANMVSKHPNFAISSLENNIIPIYEMIRRFSQSDKEAVSFIINCPYVFMGARLAQNVKLLLDEGVTPGIIPFFFRHKIYALLSYNLKKTVDEVKELGFDPSQVKFAIALVAKRTVPKPLWDAKVDALKSWGWSEEAISEAFRRQPLCMLVSKDKINEIMRLWVHQLGWNPLAPVKNPVIFGYSIEKRIIPRAFVVQYLLARGLRNKNECLVTPFRYPEKLFLQRFVDCFTDERSQLVKIYLERKNVEVNRE